ncbi:tetratricopeptide repeat protein [Bacillus sp. CRN 9]|nr:tetratricopeptide repeat protein [Bacillus sp. CRN 9]
MNIIDSKLKIPNFSHCLERHRLLNELDSHLDSPLFLVTGNSGYGKTFLVSNYIKMSNIPCIWYSLTNNDCYGHIFLSYLKKGILHLENKNLYNDILEPNSIEKELKKIISIFSGRTQPMYIVLDNYELVAKSPEIQSIMNQLLDECSSMVKYIIISEVRPDLHFSKLKLQQKYNELTTFDLAFTIGETRDFFNKINNLELEEHEIKLIHSKTEGWVASYQLVLGIIKKLDRKERTFFWTSFPDVPDIYDYLSTEVFEAQNQEIKTFLYKTSLLSELNPNIINHFLGIDHSGRILKQLLKHHLFIYQDEQGVIRYHRLFRRFLYKKFNNLLGYEDIRSEHLKLALIYEENYQFKLAFVHLIIGRDYSHAARLIEKIGDRYNPIELMIFLNGWLEENTLQKSIANNTIFLVRCIPLSVLKELTGHFEKNIMLLKKEKNELWLCNLQHRLATIYLVLGDLMKAKHLYLESLKGAEMFHDDPLIALNLNLLAEIYRYLGDYPEAIKSIRRALYISDRCGNRHIQLHALDTIAGIYLDKGKIFEATSYIQEALNIAINHDHSSLVFVYSTMGRMSRLKGIVHEAIEWGEKAVKIAKKYNSSFDRGISNQELGNSYLENDQLVEAEGCFSEAYQAFTLHSYYQCILIMSEKALYQKMGELTKKKEKTNELHKICRENNYYWLYKKIKPPNQIIIKEKEDTLLKIYTLGNFKIYYGNQLITIKRTSSLQLLQFLVTNRNKKIEKDILIDTIFPEGPLDSNQNQLTVALSVLRKSIEPNIVSGNQSSYILRSKSHYMFNTQKVDLDIETFKELTLNNDDPHSKDNIQKMVTALQLYKGDYFEEYPYTSFLETERESIQLLYLKICRTLAKYYYEQKEYLKSIELFENIFKKDPYQELIYFEYIHLLLTKNFVAQAKNVAHRMIQKLELEMGIEVQDRLNSLFSQFK